MIQENIQIYKREFCFSVGGAGKNWAMNWYLKAFIEGIS
jgi:hypothetical protein